MEYRLYIDEVGNSDMGASNDPNHRYLNLTGVILDLDYVTDIFHPQMESLKQAFFGSHPDEPIIFHRRELVRRLKPFEALNNPATRIDFDALLLNYLQEWEYFVVSVSIDKLELLNRYGSWHRHPYHYCLLILLERYVMFLENNQVQGDVMAEARGGREDMALKDAFVSIYESGTDYIKAERFQNRLTSKQLKLKKKENNIAGLQLADLLAHPSHKSILASKRNQKQPDDFGRQIIEILSEDKYLRSPRNNCIDGFGKKWLP